MRVVVMGVSGCGKSTIGKTLATTLNLNSPTRFIDGDDLHPESNIKKMSQGIPLNDEDREPWLRDVGKALAVESNCVIACSALKRKYRDLIREFAPDAIFLHLVGSEELLSNRMNSRNSHFMKPWMLQSQLATLEELQSDEAGGRYDISKSPAEIVNKFLADYAK